MPKVVGIRFKKTPKIYYFEAGDHDYIEGCGVIVETARGVEYGNAVIMPMDVEDDKIVGTLKPIIRIATDKDKENHEALEAKRAETMKLASEKIIASGLPMKLVDAKYTFDGAKLIVYFTAEGRVDFRELVRELASVFHVRIELRQIGSRDECKMVGGMGPCGRPCCCSAYNLEYSHVSIKMAKNQGLALNPGKINGLCGNLMCCLDYENEYYSEVNKMMPKMGSEVQLSDGSKGIVSALNQLKKTVTVKVLSSKDDSFSFSEVPLDSIKFKTKNSGVEDEESEAQVE
ncbi:MAG: stage 0 sporulation family protein [Clostridiales bacterium]|nr:stage 0 sporulation family protein [Clostridiales bacterium]